MCRPKNDAVEQTSISNIAECTLNKPTDVETSSLDPDTKVQCDLCEEWFHAAFAGSKDFIDFIGRDEPAGPGHNNGGLAVHLWFCSNCVTMKSILTGQIKEVLKLNLRRQPPLKKDSGENATEETVGLSAPTHATATFADVHTTPPVCDEVTKRVTCKYYEKGICRHGQNGKKLWNGQTCGFLHPKKCIRFCKYGFDPYRGCTRKDCRLFHPILCNNSVEYGKCYKSNCTFQHLHDTDRNVQGYNYSANKTSNSNSAYNRRGNRFFSRRGEFSDERNPVNIQKIEPFSYKTEEFPPLPSMFQQDKIDELSSTMKKMQSYNEATMKKMQSSLTFLMERQQQNNFPSVQPTQFVESTNFAQNNQHFQNQPYSTYTQPQQRSEAKN